MKNNLLYTAGNNNLNPCFQQHLPQGRMQARDAAFFMRKLSFMQRLMQGSILPEKKDNDTEAGNDNDRH